MDAKEAVEVLKNVVWRTRGIKEVLLIPAGAVEIYKDPDEELSDLTQEVLRNTDLEFEVKKLKLRLAAWGQSAQVRFEEIQRLKVKLADWKQIAANRHTEIEELKQRNQVQEGIIDDLRKDRSRNFETMKNCRKLIRVIQSCNIKADYKASL
ncbi:hypothetical protein LCGC14_1745760 [marine sediment metagenome]|uniref:Uncharacterized protein n=1 Tax=marine sediment metagenome TaxID=412755 RepID=A0A0F9K4W7_9ZZZZ